MHQPHRLTQSTEKYLETILRLDRQKGMVRVTDIAAELKLQKGTVSGALRNLKAHQLVRYEPYGRIELTAAGRQAAAGIARRYHILVRFMVEVLRMKPEPSETAARRMGPAVEQTVIERMRRCLQQT